MNATSARFSALAIASSLMLLNTPATATSVCAVQPSRDGYVALRDKPTTSGKLIARARAGQAVVIQQRTNGEQIISGRWARVLHYPGDVIPASTDPAFKKSRIGWMSIRYVNDCG
jgi:hypothetical protein